MISLRLINEAKLHSALIRWFSWSDWNHVDFALPDGTFLGARIEGGVQIRPANYTSPRRSLYLGVSLGAELEARILWLARQQIGKPYNLLGILGFPLRRDFGDGKSFFCSQLVAWCFDQAPYPLLIAKPDRISPGMLAESPLLSHVGYAAARPGAPA